MKRFDVSPLVVISTSRWRLQFVDRVGKQLLLLKMGSPAGVKMSLKTTGPDKDEAESKLEQRYPLWRYKCQST